MSRHPFPEDDIFASVDAFLDSSPPDHEACDLDLYGPEDEDDEDEKEPEYSPDYEPDEPDPYDSDAAADRYERAMWARWDRA